MASNAGLNRAVTVALTLQPTAAAYTTPLANYGVTGVNDSGMILPEAANFGDWTFSMVPVGPAGSITGYTVSCYGTNDPTATALWRYNNNPGQNVAVTLPAGSWFLLPGPSEQSGTGSSSNPMSGTSPVFQAKIKVLAVRVVLTAAATPSGAAKIIVSATP